MARSIGLAITSILISAAFGTLDGQQGSPNPEVKGQRVQLIAKLRDDLNRVAFNPGVGEKQLAKFESIKGKLAEAEAALRKGGIISPLRMLKMRGAINELTRLAEDGVLSAPDRRLVLDDIHRLKQMRP
ncbi:MAG TPA: hypothetical protein PKJ41_02770 [Bryobacteraceae bacterium]|nr:hypothetical protein [Bryobacteraceae bacterium]HPT26451.1 hypothetical protein [Bryobacteraceae bacterium]